MTENTKEEHYVDFVSELSVQDFTNLTLNDDSRSEKSDNQEDELSDEEYQNNYSFLQHVKPSKINNGFIKQFALPPNKKQKSKKELETENYIED